MEIATNTHLDDQEIRVFYLDGWTYRHRPSQDKPKSLLLMLHGWTGDENSMWLFTRNIPQQYSILLPRAPNPAPGGGFSWRSNIPGLEKLPALSELQNSAETLLAFIDRWISTSGLDLFNFDIVGFSQGAAMALSLALLFPDRVGKVAALSGFLPDCIETQLSVLEGKKIFISHGRSDDLIPVARARQAIVLLKRAGVNVNYCESEGGHKISKECLRELESCFIIREA